jgi:hypothetical protein
MNRHRRSAQLSLLDSVLLKAKLYVSAMRTGFVLTGLPSASKAPGFALSSNPLEVVKHVDLNNTESPQLPERVGTSQKLQLKVDIKVIATHKYADHVLLLNWMKGSLPRIKEGLLPTMGIISMIAACHAFNTGANSMSQRTQTKN